MKCSNYRDISSKSLNFGCSKTTSGANLGEIRVLVNQETKQNNKTKQNVSHTHKLYYKFCVSVSQRIVLWLAHSIVSVSEVRLMFVHSVFLAVAATFDVLAAYQQLTSFYTGLSSPFLYTTISIGRIQENVLAACLVKSTVFFNGALY